MKTSQPVFLHEQRKIERLLLKLAKIKPVSAKPAPIATGERTTGVPLERNAGRPITPMNKFRRKQRGNPDWGKPIHVPVLITEFDRQVERLGLINAQYADSAELRHWCNRNRNRVYVPEWLLKEWGMTVEAIFSGVA